MNEQIYLHCLFAHLFGYDTKSSLLLLEEILKSKYLLSARERGVLGNENFCGRDYISLEDYERRFITKSNKYNGYNQYAIECASIIFPKGKFEVIRPTILDKKISEYPNCWSLMRELGLKEERYSDLEDEVHVKDRLSLEYMNGITLPTNQMFNGWKNIKNNVIAIRNDVLRYKELLDKYGYDIPIYDVETLLSLEDNENIEELVVSLKKKNKWFK